MGTWNNEDGLTLHYGVDKAVVEPIGEYRYNGPVRAVEVKFTWEDLPLVADNSVVIGDKYSLPKGANIERVEIYSNVDFTSGGSALLNVGWVDLDGTTAADVDAFVEVATPAELNSGGVNISGWVGTAVNGTPLATAKLLTWEVDGAAFTAGEGYIRIFYSVAHQELPA